MRWPQTTWRRSFLDLALARCTTGSFTTVDGGNITAALRQSACNPCRSPRLWLD
jgi:hypothetical protein